MNEQIKKLSNQAYDDLVNQTGNIVVFDEDFQQRFAELIVQKCAEVAAEHDALDIYEEIREHFGVEE
jgi:hypothetical protein